MQWGCKAVTVANVPNIAGTAKGGFYHHFAARADLLAGVIARRTAQGLTEAEAARSQKNGDALAKLNAVLAYPAPTRAQEDARV